MVSSGRRKRPTRFGLVVLSLGLLGALRLFSVFRRSASRLGHGDIGVFLDVDSRNESDRLVIKRVLAVGNDTIRIKDGVLVVNDEVVLEPYKRHGPFYLAAGDSWPSDPEGAGVRPVTVPADSYFVMGDNRGESLDSRTIGSIPHTNVVGRVVFALRTGSRELCLSPDVEIFSE